jgi:hypothetical protein
MKLALIGPVVALATFALTANGAVAAEQKGQGCDLRGVQGSGCKPGETKNPDGGTPFNKGPINQAHNGGSDKLHLSPGGTRPTDPPPPPPSKQ